MPREGISMVRGKRLANKLYVILFSFGNISCNAGSDFVCLAMKLEVCMVHNN
jgi:hypothetical protein